MQVDSCSSDRSTSLAKLPVDILKGVFGWIHDQSIDACMLKQSCSTLQWILKQYMGWNNKINANLPFTHQIGQICRYLPVLTQEATISLKATSLRCGNFANFKGIPEVVIDDKILFRYLIEPIEYGYLDCLNSLLDMYKGRVTQMHFDELLAHTCWYGHRDMVELLISLGADVKSNENLALNRAASEGYMHIITLLCIHGADIHFNRIAHMASGKGHLNVLVFLLALGVNVAADNNTLISACIHGHFDVVKFLMSVRSSANVNDDSPLQQASRYGYLDIVKYLYVHGNYTSGACEFAAMDASKYGYLEIVKFLHTVGVNVRLHTDWAFRYACAYGHLEVAMFLVSVGADIHASEDYAIRKACDGGHAHVVKYLHGCGAPVNMSETTLVTAAVEGHLALLQFFHSIEPITAHPKLLSSASKYNNIELVEWLHSIGFDVHYGNDLAIRLASEYNSLSVVKFLHSVGANIRADNDAPLRNASQFGHLDIVVFLHSVGATISARIWDAMHLTDRMMRSGVAAFLKSVMDADEVKNRKLFDTVDQ